MTKKLIICKGLPASGKSTWSKEVLVENPDYVRVNRDDIRSMMGERMWSRKFEDIVTSVEHSLIISALGKGYSVIVDDTNLNEKTVEALKSLIEDEDCEVVEKIFDTPLEECILRDSKRSKPVGENVIRGMYDKYIEK